MSFRKILAIMQSKMHQHCRALPEWTLKTWGVINSTRPQKLRMRTVSEFKVIEKPEKWTELTGSNRCPKIVLGEVEV